jgi:hypothetical protein
MSRSTFPHDQFLSPDLQIPKHRTSFSVIAHRRSQERRSLVPGTVPQHDHGAGGKEVRQKKPNSRELVPVAVLREATRLGAIYSPDGPAWGISLCIAPAPVRWDGPELEDDCKRWGLAVLTNCQ